jgi:hypothetical protein
MTRLDEPQRLTSRRRRAGAISAVRTHAEPPGICHVPRMVVIVRHPLLVIGILLVGFVGFLAVIVATAHRVGDNDLRADHFGSVPLPGSSIVELDAGTVGVYYRTDTYYDLKYHHPSDPLAEVVVRAPKGGSIAEYEKRQGGEGFFLERSRLIGRLVVPADGAYRVTVSTERPLTDKNPRIEIGDLYEGG